MSSQNPRPRIDWLLIGAATVLIAGFVISFVLGLRATRPPAISAPVVRGTRVPITEPINRRRVEVLNGAGVPGLARDATARLRAAGFDVVFFGNTTAESASVVIDRAGRRQLAVDAAKVLGIARVISQADTTRLVEASIILGRDWAASRSDTTRAATIRD